MPAFITVALAMAASQDHYDRVECRIRNPNGSYNSVQVTFEEAKGTVRFVHLDTSMVERRPAVFSPTSVKWTALGNGGSYEFSRRNYTIVRTRVAADNTVVTEGTCRLH